MLLLILPPAVVLACPVVLLAMAAVVWYKARR